MVGRQELGAKLTYSPNALQMLQGFIPTVNQNSWDADPFHCQFDGLSANDVEALKEVNGNSCCMLLEPMTGLNEKLLSDKSISWATALQKTCDVIWQVHRKMAQDLSSTNSRPQAVEI